MEELLFIIWLMITMIAWAVCGVITVITIMWIATRIVNFLMWLVYTIQDLLS